jgi:hypothetical protein
MAQAYLTITRRPRGSRRLLTASPARAGAPSSAAADGSMTAGTGAGSASTPGAAGSSPFGKPAFDPDRTVLSGGGGVTVEVGDARRTKQLTPEEERRPYKGPPRWAREAIRKGSFDWTLTRRDDMDRLMHCLSMLVPAKAQPVRMGELARLGDAVVSCTDEDAGRAADAVEKLVRRGYVIPPAIFAGLRAYVDEISAGEDLAEPPQEGVTTDGK